MFINTLGEGMKEEPDYSPGHPLTAQEAIDTHYTIRSSISTEENTSLL